MNQAEPTANFEKNVTVYDTHIEAEAAIRAIEKSGFDMTKVSVVGKNYKIQAETVGYHSTGIGLEACDETGSFWGSMFGPVSFWVPGIGPLLAAGPIVAWIVGAQECFVIVGGLSVLGTALFSLGIRKHKVSEYETQIQAGKFVVIAHDAQDELANSKAALEAPARQEALRQEAPKKDLMSQSLKTDGRLRQHPSTRFIGSQHAFDLQQLSSQLEAEAHPGEHGHRQITIFHHGATTMVLFAFEAKGTLSQHKINGMVTIQVIDGTLTVTAEEQTHSLNTGQFLVLSPDVPHSITACEASHMLLTVHLEKAAETGKQGETPMALPRENLYQ